MDQNFSHIMIQSIRNSAAYGVKTNTPIVNLVEVIQRKRSVVQSAREMNLHNLETALDKNLIIGTARFVAPKTIEVTTTEENDRLLTAERLFINTGTRPLIPSIPGLTEVEFLTSESIMELEQLPEHLIANVGLTETEAQQQGYAIHVAKVDASAVARAKTLGQTDGLLKAIVDTETGRLVLAALVSVVMIIFPV